MGSVRLLIFRTGRVPRVWLNAAYLESFPLWMTLLMSLCYGCVSNENPGVLLVIGSKFGSFSEGSIYYDG